MNTSMRAEALRRLIRDVPDFPKPGIVFRDITPLLKSSQGFCEVLALLEERAAAQHPTAVVGIESRGFIFGAPLAVALRVPFIPVRKPGKLPAARMQVEYSLEYGTGQLDIHADALGRTDAVVIVDDVLATGGTARGAAKLVELLGAKVVLQLFVVELCDLGGRAKLNEYQTESILQY